MGWKNNLPQDKRYYETDKGILYIGDCLEILNQFQNDSIDLVLTDPPYNISQNGEQISRRDSSIKLDFGDWDKMEDDEFFHFTETWFAECSRLLKKGGWICSFFDKQKTGLFDLIFAKKYGIKSKTILVWIKSNPVPQFRKANFTSASEFIWCGVKGEGKIINFGKQKEMVNFFFYPNKSTYGKTNHPTEKPEFIMEKLITYLSNEEDIVLDPFIGSGTTAVVCEKLNRRWIGIEKDEEYCRIATKRIWEEIQQLKLF